MRETGAREKEIKGKDPVRGIVVRDANNKWSRERGKYLGWG